MKINRLFGIVYILLDKGTVTAKELSEHFEVSTRTIYRDIDTLSGIGIPLYTNKGKYGGISILDNFVLNKSILSDQEQNEILMSLQSLKSIKFPEIDSVLNKLSTFFNKREKEWIDVDFSDWSSDDSESEKFNLIKIAILNKSVLVFDYFSSYGEKTKRTVEPMKLLFKGQGWYIHGFCRVKNDFRIFKIKRIKNICSLNETFKRETPKDIWSNFKSRNNSVITLVLKIDKSMAYRVYDEFDPECIQKDNDGHFIVNTTFPEAEWIYGYILSYGNSIEVLSPKHIREEIKIKLENGLKKYL
ncbi:DeoR family transcriptional regulator [Gottschalkia acidurici 9a]|uniref:DeoR family transcriptional regulator n=1 Tax=Gottschalkia acidurici (strain ATCC 7906 / DSM 604 / BCRC 14475 / CIP 104303 / KCTC 5404 / NCIMB 10678 / 9a) TaxID=1128398 RepID=K0AYJ6_GOTA9|nr:YafY family protein [Gottschalkia acidurici]AFS77842.1 DeoR family transcriptional regulator [Gottschalkia acidurici 9a]